MKKWQKEMNREFPTICKAKIGYWGDKKTKFNFNKWIYGVECKSNGYLDKEEKEKVKWLLEHNIFSKILIASKGKKRGEIIYNDSDE